MSRSKTPDDAPPRLGMSRRSFIGSSGALAGALGIASGQAQAQEQEQEAPGVPADGQRTIELTVNGKTRTVPVEPRTTLVEALRDTLGMTRTKIGCNQASAAPAPSS